jgi:hypothetical protein
MRPIEIRTLKPGDKPHHYVPDLERSAALSRIVTQIIGDREVYARAADLIEAGGLSKGTLACDEHGAPIALESPEARSFCALGAFCRAAIDLGHLDGRTLPGHGLSEAESLWPHLVTPITQAVGPKAHDELGTKSMNWWNNREFVTQDDVVAALRQADPERIA